MTHSGGIATTIGNYLSTRAQLDVWPLRSPTLKNHVKLGVSDRPLRLELHCALETGYTVTLLSISSLAGYKPVTTQLHGYIAVHQQLNSQLAIF
jgi:hypothetical protein